MNFIYRFIRELEPKTNINILMYHGFTDEKEPSGIANYHGKHLDIHKFREQISYLKNHYHIISLERLIAFYVRKESIPERSVVVTMDDGYRSNYTLAFPVLKEFQVPATIFIATDFIDQKEFLWFDRIEYAINRTGTKILHLKIDNKNLDYGLVTLEEKKEADSKIKLKLKKMPPAQRNAVIDQLEQQLGERLTFQNGVPSMYVPLEWPQISGMIKSNLVTIGNHTLSHTILTVLNAEDIKKELECSKRRIEEMTQRTNNVFSYPNGWAGDFNEQTKRILQELGFRCALTTVIGSNNSDSDVFELKRLNLHNEGDFGGFVRTLSSFWRFLRKVKSASLLGE